MQLLEYFIKNSEIKRATAVKMLLCGYKHEEIMPILGVSSGFISTYKKSFFKMGIHGLKLGHKGSFGYLDDIQRAEVIEWLQTKEFITYAAEKGNSKNTINFLEYLRQQRPLAKLLIIWDGASYHRSQEIPDYLDSLNRELEKEQWWITCLRFAPNAPQQNSVEDIWLQAKRLIREFYFFCHSFKVVKALFELSIHCQIFDFPKLHEYGVFS
ncbi:transposase [Nostoc sp.]|uniref:transposase n=1 Tax=Nostoc sp. TaxID=1180 RepID=UPI002FF5EDD0